jgi:putative SOS response-associated peptidase YedK
MDLRELIRNAGGAKRPTDQAPVVRGGLNGFELVSMRWGFAPGANGEPVINIQSEGRRFAKKRCLIPATELDLFTGTGKPKTRWRARLTNSDWFCFAGIWREAKGNWPESFAALTIQAAPDLQHLTERQIAVIRPEDARAWLTLSRPQKTLLRPLAAGSYVVERA